MINPYAVMYDARMDIYRYVEEEINNITTHGRKLVASERPCRYSSSGQAITQGIASGIINKHKLFCGLNEDIKEGDHLVITLRNGKKIEVDLGECNPYTWQWQCEVERNDYV